MSKDKYSNPIGWTKNNAIVVFAENGNPHSFLSLDHESIRFLKDFNLQTATVLEKAS